MGDNEDPAGLLRFRWFGKISWKEWIVTGDIAKFYMDVYDNAILLFRRRTQYRGELL